MIKNWIGLKTFIHREINRFLRVWIQTLMSPWINATLYILIFGFIVGSKIDQIAGVSYIDFVLPGVLMLNLINSSFGQTSSSVYFQRFARFIEEVLIAPLSELEMIIGYVVGGITRGFVVGFGIFILAVIFSAANLSHIGWFIFYAVSVAIIFSLVGILVGMWAENFEQQSLINTFIITPFTFLGGVFNSIEMLPEQAQIFVKFNPFFYFVDGLRYSMIGVSEANTTIGFILIVSLIIGLTWLVWYLFKIGWRIRE
ncbi:MAG: ABC transporter permease [Parcubacteria group bacterium QH_9_35_7]|nr:MAG: ABC transporter permease [Parcubacteria group bacterium QH_9_35_7]